MTSAPRTGLRGERQTKSSLAPASTQVLSVADLHLCGADDGIRTRDPNLGKDNRGTFVTCDNSAPCL